MKKYGNQLILLITVMIWGSLYVVSRVVLSYIPALFLLFLRLSISSVLLIGLAKIKKLGKIRGKDRREVFLIGFLGYFISNAALLLGIQYSNASFSSLVNAMCPIFISIFAVLLLKERMDKKEIISLAVAVLGAVVIIGNPGGNITQAGIFFCLLSLILWSYTNIHIKKLAAKYHPILVTGYSMGVGAIMALPSSLIFIKVTGAKIHIESSMILPTLYICIICTAVSHLLWNFALSKTDATKCAAFYPIQPLTSMTLGILILHEEVTESFLIGAVLVGLAMVIHAFWMPNQKIPQKF